MIKRLWDKLFINITEVQNNRRLIKLLWTDLDGLKNESLKKNYKKISKSKIDILKTYQEHQERFLEALNDSKEYLVLLFNWTEFYVMNDNFENSLRSCLARGVNVYIGYTFKHSVDSKLDDSEVKAKNKFKELQNWCFSEHGQGCRLHEIERPSLKTILIVDDKYLINGNCENENRSWILYDKDFVTSERNNIIGNLDGPLDITRRGLFRNFVPGSFNCI
jgi:hypothetical protein